MPKLITDKEKIYDSAIVAKAFDGSIVVNMPDKRLISEIAPEFEGINHMTYVVTESETPYQKEYNGYSVLSAILRTDFDGNIQISLRKSNGGE